MKNEDTVCDTMNSLCSRCEKLLCSTSGESQSGRAAGCVIPNEKAASSKLIVPPCKVVLQMPTMRMRLLCKALDPAGARSWLASGEICTLPYGVVLMACWMADARKQSPKRQRSSLMLVSYRQFSMLVNHQCPALLLHSPPVQPKVQYAPGTVQYLCCPLFNWSSRCTLEILR